MKNSFLSLCGTDGRTRAFHVDDLRLLEDFDADSDSGAIEAVTVTLCDGTQFAAKGDSAGVIKQIEALEP